MQDKEAEMQDEREKPILTLIETARKLRLSKATMANLLSDGTIPGIKVGRQWRVLNESVDAFLRGGNGQSSGTEETRPAA